MAKTNCPKCHKPINILADRVPTGQFFKLRNRRIPKHEWEYWVVRDCECKLDESSEYYLKEEARAEYYNQEADY